MTEISSLLSTLRAWPHMQIDRWRNRIDNLHQANYDMGRRFAEQGKLSDALFRFKMAVRQKPDFTLAWYQLGVVHLRNGEPRLAKIALKKALSLRAHYTEAAYMLATIDPAAVPAEDRPTRMPAGMMEHFFTQVAPVYDQLEAQNQYQGPHVCVEKLRPYLPATSGLSVVDVGCGVGHLARLWRRVASRMIGIDATPAMTERAALTKTAEDVVVFDAVHTHDIRTLPDGVIAPASMDVVLLGNVAQFIGDLSVTFQKISAMLKPGGLMIVTVEPCGGEYYSVMPATARFGHSDAYVRAQAALVELEAVAQEKASLYPNTQVTVHVLRKKASA